MEKPNNPRQMGVEMTPKSRLRWCRTTAPWRGPTLHVPLHPGDQRASTDIKGMTHSDQCIECRGVLVQLDHTDVIPADIRQEAELLLRESSGLAGFSEFVTDHTTG